MPFKVAFGGRQGTLVVMGLDGIMNEAVSQAGGPLAVSIREGAVSGSQAAALQALRRGSEGRSVTQGVAAVRCFMGYTRRKGL